MDRGPGGLQFTGSRRVDVTEYTHTHTSCEAENAAWSKTALYLLLWKPGGGHLGKRESLDREQGCLVFKSGLFHAFSSFLEMEHFCFL